MDDESLKKRKLKFTIIWFTIASVLIIVFSFVFYNLFSKWHKDAQEKEFNTALTNIKNNLLVNSSGVHYDFDISGHTVKIKLWQEGMAEAAMQAENGNDAALSNWTELKGSMYELSCAYYKQFILVDDAVIYLSLVNEYNTDRELLTFKDRELIYDVVTGYKAGG